MTKTVECLNSLTRRYVNNSIVGVLSIVIYILIFGIFNFDIVNTILSFIYFTTILVNFMNVFVVILNVESNQCKSMLIVFKSNGKKY